MKSNYVCSDFECNYSTNRTDNLKLKDLREVVKNDGGIMENNYSKCPKCGKNSLVYLSESK